MIVRHHRRRPAPAPRSPLSELGAALVELALIVPALLLLGGGTWEMGMGWRAGIATATAARAGARTGSSMENNVKADMTILTSVRASLDSSDLLNSVEWVIIFRSDSTNGALPSTCLSGSASTGCVRVSGTQLRAMLESYTDAQFTTYFNTNGCLKTASPQNWCPTARDDVQLTAEYLGVYVQVKRNYTFPMVGSGVTIKRQAIMRLEPG